MRVVEFVVALSVILFALAALAAALVLPVLIVILTCRAHKVSRGATISDRGFLNRLAIRWGRWSAKNQAKAEANRERWRSERAAKVLAASLPVNRSASHQDPKYRSAPAAVDLGADARLQAAYDRLIRKEISLTDYARQIEDELNSATDLRSAILLGKSTMHPDVFDIEMEEVEADIEAAQWRKEWVADRLYKESLSRSGFAESGSWARFKYVDHHGEVTNREIVRWEKRGPYIVGFDRGKGEERTFRQDRIINWRSGDNE